jgi:WD40 repeat protein
VLLFLINSFAFAQQEIPIFFNNDLGISTKNRYFILAYSPEGSKIATIYNENKIIVWDASNGNEIKRIDGHGNHAVSEMVFSPNGRQLVSCSSADSTVKIWDTTSGTLIRSINQAGVLRVSFSPDGNRIVGIYFIQGNNGIKIWNTANGSEIRTIAGSSSYAIFSPDEKNILVTDENSVKIFDAGNGQTLRTINSKNNEYFLEQNIVLTENS